MPIKGRPQGHNIPYNCVNGNWQTKTKIKINIGVIARTTNLAQDNHGIQSLSYAGANPDTWYILPIRFCRKICHNCVHFNCIQVTYYQVKYFNGKETFFHMVRMPTSDNIRCLLSDCVLALFKTEFGDLNILCRWREWSRSAHDNKWGGNKKGKPFSQSQDNWAQSRTAYLFTTRHSVFVGIKILSLR